MPDNYSLIIKNGSCYINGKFESIDLAISGDKIKKVGKVDLNSSKVFSGLEVVIISKPFTTLNLCAFDMGLSFFTGMRNN